MTLSEDIAKVSVGLPERSLSSVLKYRVVRLATQFFDCRVEGHLSANVTDT
jgi:hypothetical protein